MATISDTMTKVWLANDAALFRRAVQQAVERGAEMGVVIRRWGERIIGTGLLMNASEQDRQWLGKLMLALLDDLAVDMVTAIGDLRSQIEAATAGMGEPPAPTAH